MSEKQTLRDLLGKGNKKPQATQATQPAETQKSPFKKLQQTTASLKREFTPSLPEQKQSGGVASIPAHNATPPTNSGKKFSVLGTSTGRFSGNKKLSLSAKANSKPEPATPQVPDVTEGVSGSVSFEKMDLEKAKEFQHADQPEKFKEETIKKLKENLKKLEDNIGDKEFVTDAISFIMKSLRQHDFLKDIMKPQDIGLMVRGLRESYGVVIKKKETRAKKVTEKQQKESELLDKLSELDF